MSTKLETKLSNLSKDLEDVAAAEGLANLEFGNVLVRWLTARIDIHVKSITNGKYLKDHTGYVKALAALEEDRYLLRKFQACLNPGVKETLKAAVIDLQEAIEDERQ